MNVSSSSMSKKEVVRRTDILKPSEFAVAKYSGPGIASNVIVSSCLNTVISYGDQKESYR